MEYQSIPRLLLLTTMCFHGPATLGAGETLVLSNAVIEGQWTLDDSRITALVLTNKHTDQMLRLKTGHVPRIVLDDGRVIDLAALTPTASSHRENGALRAAFEDDASGLEICWSAELGVKHGIAFGSWLEDDNKGLRADIIGGFLNRLRLRGHEAIHGLVGGLKNWDWRLLFWHLILHIRDNNLLNHCETCGLQSQQSSYAWVNRPRV